MRLSFTVSGAPVTWKRTNRVDGRSLTPKGQRAYQNAIAMRGRAARPSTWPLDARYRLVVTAYRASDQGDWDNYGKNVSDALEGVLWSNDRRVKDGRCVLEIDRERPRLEVVVEVMV